MKNTLLRIYVFSFFLLSDVIVFAQGLPVDDEDGDLQGGDPVVPVNGKLVWLAIAGILFAVYTFKRKRQIQTK